MLTAFTQPKVFCWNFGSTAVEGSTGYNWNENIWKNKKFIPIARGYTNFPSNSYPPGAGTTYPSVTGTDTQKVGTYFANIIQYMYDQCLLQGRKLDEIGIFMQNLGFWNESDPTQHNGICQGIWKHPADALSSYGGAERRKYEVPWRVNGTAFNMTFTLDCLNDLKTKLASRGLNTLRLHFIWDDESYISTDFMLPASTGNYTAITADTRWNNLIVLDGKTMSQLFSDYTGAGGTLDTNQGIYQPANYNFNKWLNWVFHRLHSKMIKEVVQDNILAVFPGSSFTNYNEISSRKDSRPVSGGKAWSLGYDTNISQIMSHGSVLYAHGNPSFDAANSQLVNFESTFNLPSSGTSLERVKRVWKYQHIAELKTSQEVAKSIPNVPWFSPPNINLVSIAELGLTNISMTPQEIANSHAESLKLGNMWAVIWNHGSYAGQAKTDLDTLFSLFTKNMTLYGKKSRFNVTNRPNKDNINRKIG